MSDYHINIFYSDEDGGYIADIPDLEACSAFGKTPQEALAEVERAKAAWLQAAREVAQPDGDRATGRRSIRPNRDCVGRVALTDPPVYKGGRPKRRGVTKGAAWVPRTHPTRCNGPGRATTTENIEQGMSNNES